MAAKKKAAKKKAKAPVQCTPELTALIVSDLEEGLLVLPVCIAHGMSKAAVYLWQQKGSAGKEPYATWYAAITQASGKGEVGLGRRALRGDQKGEANGRAAMAAKWLTATHGKRYNPKITVQIERELDVLLDVLAKVLPAEQYAECLAALSDVDDDGQPLILGPG